MDQRKDSSLANADIPHWRRRIENPSRLVLIILLMVGLLLTVNFIYRLSVQNEVGMVRFIIGGEPVTLDEQAQVAFGHDLKADLADFEEEIQKRMQPWQESALNKVETDFNISSEHYLDWYFSFSGSYMRLGYAAVGDLKPWMEEQLQQRLVGPSGLEDSFKALREEHAERLAEAEQALLSKMLADLQRKYLPVSVSDGEADMSRIETIDLDQVVSLTRQDQLDLARWSATQGGGGVLGALAGNAIVHRLSASTAMKTGRNLVRNLVIRMGGQATRSIAVGGTAAAVTAPSGPGALVVGVSTAGASLAMAAGSEYAALKVQEALNRPEMESDLKDSWSELETEMLYILQADQQARAKALLDTLSHRASQAIQDSGLPKTYNILD